MTPPRPKLSVSGSRIAWRNASLSHGAFADGETVLIIDDHDPTGDAEKVVLSVIIDDRGLEIILKDLARDLGEGSVNVRAPDLLVARRERNRAAASNKERN